MLLLYLLGILFLVFLAAVFFGRVLAWLLEIIAQRVLHLDLKVETLGLFAANGVRIKTSNGVRIGMEKICLHCKWTMNDTKRLFTLLFKSVVIEVEREKHQTKLKKPDEPQGRPNSSSSNFVAKHKQILSRVLRKCCQYLGIQVSSVELQLRSKDVWLTQCILPDGLHVSARPDNTNCLLCTLEISKMATKFFSGKESEVVAISDPFAQLSCSFLMEISLVPFERSKFLKAAVNMKNLDIWLSEGLAGKTPEQAVNIQTESKESSSTVVTPMTFDEIQDSISGFPESAELAVDAAKVTFLNKDKRELVFEVNQATSSLHCKKNLQNGLTQDPTHCDLSIQMSGVNYLLTQH